jgi:hypothetical protein
MFTSFTSSYTPGSGVERSFARTSTYTPTQEPGDQGEKKEIYLLDSTFSLVYVYFDREAQYEEARAHAEQYPSHHLEIKTFPILHEGVRLQVKGLALFTVLLQLSLLVPLWWYGSSEGFSHLGVENLWEPPDLEDTDNPNLVFSTNFKQFAVWKIVPFTVTYLHVLPQFSIGAFILGRIASKTQDAFFTAWSNGGCRACIGSGIGQFCKEICANWQMLFFGLLYGASGWIAMVDASAIIVYAATVKDTLADCMALLFTTQIDQVIYTAAQKGSFGQGLAQAINSEDLKVAVPTYSHNTGCGCGPSTWQKLHTLLSYLGFLTYFAFLNYRSWPADS